MLSLLDDPAEVVVEDIKLITYVCLQDPTQPMIFTAQEKLHLCIHHPLQEYHPFQDEPDETEIDNDELVGRSGLHAHKLNSKSLLAFSFLITFAPKARRREDLQIQTIPMKFQHISEVACFLRSSDRFWET